MGGNIKFRGGNPRQSCEIWKNGVPFKRCSYFNTNEDADTIDTVFTCGRSEDFPCHPLYNKLDAEEIAERVKKIDQHMADFRKRTKGF